MPTGLETLRDAWRARWPQALSLWSRYTQLLEPRWCVNAEDEKREGLSGSFAMIRLADHAIVISLAQIMVHKLEKFSLEIMGHEIGHHVLAPADATDHGRLMLRIRAGLPTQEYQAPFIANLYTDLLINDRLQRSEELDMAGLYRAIGNGSADPLWTLYMRIYELLWRLPTGELAKGKITRELEGDAQLGARLVRHYRRDWLRGAGGFAALCLPYLLEQGGQAARQIMKGMSDMDAASEGSDPDGLIEIEGEETEKAEHPSQDAELNGDGLRDEDKPGKGKGKSKGKGKTGKERGGESDHAGGREQIGGRKSRKNYRGPSEYGDLLRSLGIKTNAKENAMRYYRKRAMPHLIRFPGLPQPKATEPLPEGLDTWDIGSPLHSVDWLETVLRSPRVIPGLTTVERTYGDSPGFEPEERPVDLYLGIDCSGSMPNPQFLESYPIVAATIMALSALRAGAKVKVVLSGESPGKAKSTEGFVTREEDALSVLTDYLGTGYAFGIHRLDETFAQRKPGDPPAHLLIITDTDIYSMLESDFKKRKGWDVAREAVIAAGGGATYVLHTTGEPYKNAAEKRMRDDGWSVYHVWEWEDLVAFAADFSRRHFERQKR